MNRVTLDASWPESWKYSYPYDLEEIYGQNANPGYSYAYQQRRDETLRLLTSVLPPGARILDVAAAQGNFSIALAEMGYRVTWNDLRADLAGYVKLKQSSGQIEFAPGNVFDIKFDALFDGVLITEVIEHVAHPDEFLSKIAELVKPGGYIVVTTPNGAYFRNWLPRFSDCEDPSVFEAIQFKPNADGHIFLLYPEEISLLSERAGLSVDESKLLINPLTNGRLGTGFLLRMLPRGIVNFCERITRTLPMFVQRRISVQLVARLKKKPCAS